MKKTCQCSRQMDYIPKSKAYICSCGKEVKKDELKKFTDYLKEYNEIPTILNRK